jgi:hypothetical protein
MRNKYFILFLIGLALINLLSIDNYHNWGDDFSLYLHESKAIISNDLLNLHRINSEMMAHKKHGPNLYPIGFPILLIPFICLNANFFVIKLLNVFLLVGIIALVKKISLRFMDEKHSNVSSLFFGASSFIFYSTNDILSDLPALFFALIVLLQVLKWRYENRFNYKNHMLYFIFSVLTLITRTAYLTFFIGIIFTIILDGLISKTINWKNYLSNITIAALPIFITVILSRFFTISDGINEEKELINIIFTPHLLINIFLKNIVYYFGLFSLSLLSYKMIVFLPIIAVFLLKKFGLIKENLLEKYSNGHKLNRLVFLLIIFFSTISIFLVWPWHQGYRFVLLNMALLFIFSLSLLSKTSLVLKQCLALSYFIIFIFGPLLTRLYSNYSVNKIVSVQRIVKRGEPGTKEFNLMIDYIKTNTRNDVLIYFFKPRALHYFAGRKSYLLNDQKLLKTGDYVLIWDKENYKLLKSVFKNKVHLSYSSGLLQLYQILK